MDKNNIHDWFNALMNEQLSAEEKQELNNLLETDKDFLAEFVFLYKAKKAAKHGQRDEWKAFYKQLERNRRISFWLLGLVAGVALLLASIFLLPRDSFTDREEIYAHFSETAPSFSVRGDEGSALLQRAETAFEAKDWKLAADNFQAFAETLPKSANFRHLARLYQGISLRNLGARQQEAIDTSNHTLIEQEAINIFRQLQSIPEYEERADWHLALCYLKGHDLDACLALLDKIVANKKHDFSSKAKDMKEAILQLE